MALAGAALPAAPQQRKPNIIVILADDMGYGDIGCYGHPVTRTPHLDALAQGGVRFTDFHSSGAVCSPTRAGLMTGRYQQRAGIDGVLFAAGPRDKGLGAEHTTFAQCLRDAGYTTAIFGKWHLGYQPEFNPVRRGFDRFRGFLSGNVDYLTHLDQTGQHDWWDGDRNAPEEGYTTDLIAKHGVDFIRENRERPFCLYLAHEAPHYPYQLSDSQPVRRPGVKAPTNNPEDAPARYRGMVEALDATVGRVMDAVRQAGLERDTFVFFFSDNGATREGSNGALRGHKSTLWEGGHRVPGIAYWPGRIAPGICREPATCLDLFPTMLDCANAPAPANWKPDGASLLPALTRGERLPDRPIFWAFQEQRAMRQGPWKLLLNAPGQDPGPALYHLEEDFAETRNLATKDPERLRRMSALLRTWESDVGIRPAQNV